MFLLETRPKRLNKKTRMCLAKRREKDHTRWPENCVTRITNYTNCLAILTKIVWNTQLNIMIFFLNTESTTCSWEVVLSTCPIMEALTPNAEETPNTLTTPRGSTRYRACWPGSMNLPSPFCTFLTPSPYRTSPRIISPILFSLQMEHMSYLRVTLFPEILYG